MYKQTIIEACLNHLQTKVNELKAMMNELSESVNSETKSTAGDKHETGRAMIQLEQEKTGQQLKEAELYLAEFAKINFSKTFQIIEQGSLVETNRGFFLIAASIGKLAVNKEAVFVISNKSPLALKLIGLKEKDTVNFNDVFYTIISIQ